MSGPSRGSVFDCESCSSKRRRAVKRDLVQAIAHRIAAQAINTTTLHGGPVPCTPTTCCPQAEKLHRPVAESRLISDTPMGSCACKALPHLTARASANEGLKSRDFHPQSCNAFKSLQRKCCRGILAHLALCVAAYFSEPVGEHQMANSHPAGKMELASNADQQLCFE